MPNHDTYDRQLRDNGLPWLIPMQRWHHHLLEQTAPFFLYFGLVSVLLTIGVQIFTITDSWNTNNEYNPLIAVGIFGLACFIPLIICVLLAKFARQTSHKTQHAIAIGSVVFFVISNLVMTYDGVTSDWLIGAVTNTLLFAAGIVAFAWLGGIAIIHWALMTGLREIAKVGSVAGKILPLTIMIVIFSYFSTEIWQITDKITARNIVLLAVAVGVLAFATSLSVAYQEIKENLHSMQSTSPRLRATMKQANIYLIIIITQLIQAIIFFVIFTLILLILGKIILHDSLIASWISHDVRYYVLPQINTPLPFSINDVRAASFVSIFATLSFIVGAATDSQYRSLLFDPIFERIKRVTQLHTTRR